jgi:hypothetical protein
MSEVAAPIKFTFPMPKRWGKEELAKTFNAYLKGPNYRDDGKFGPYRKEQGSDDHWQLDDSNDYWLHFEGDTVWLHHRYETQREVCEAMFKLFTARYNRL